VLRECILRTQRLVVTSWLARDVDDLLVVHSDAETMRFVRTTPLVDVSWRKSGSSRSGEKITLACCANCFTCGLTADRQCASFRQPVYTVAT